MLASDGCVSTTSPVILQNRFPILEIPDRPKLVNLSDVELKKLDGKTQSDIKLNMDSLVLYCRQLEIAIKTYNDYASGKNKEKAP